jgi:ferredoxin--NADP+ reductase
MYPILDARPLSPTITRYVVHAPYVARKAKPGNFVIVRVHEEGERIPLTICESDPSAGTITLIVQALGKTTRLMATRGTGSTLSDVAGPLGRPTEIVEGTTVACVGGGVGTAELYPIARALRDAGNRLYGIVGARNRDLVILQEEMRALCTEFAVTTDDGSAGTKGVVTDVLRGMLEGGAGITTVYAIGPLPMMKAVAELTRPSGTKTFASLNAVMVDGTGMCGGCRVTIGGEMKFACVDGPEFDAHRVDFDELIMRNRTFAELEKISADRLTADGRHCAAEEGRP